MATKTGNQLTVAKNPTAAETVAATILDLLHVASPASAREASALRMARKHVDELLELTDLSENEVQELKDAQAYAAPNASMLADLRTEPAYANGQG
jgi:hypothetical protein